MITERGQQQKRVSEAKCIIDHVTYFKNLVELFLWSLTLHSTDMEEQTGDSSNVLGKRKERNTGGEERANIGYVSKQLQSSSTVLNCVQLDSFRVKFTIHRYIDRLADSLL